MEFHLIGDIGGTHARFALVAEGKPQAVEILKDADFASLHDAIEAYLAKALPAIGAPRPRRGALAVAGPVTGDALAFTNIPWLFSITGLERELGFERLHVVNDFVAQALAVPRLGPDDQRQVGPGKAVPGTPIGIIGPGSGLGVSSLVPIGTAIGTRWLPLPGEGGHVTLSTVGPREAEIVEWLHRHGREHVSAERLISGPGLVLLYQALRALDGATTEKIDPAQVTERAKAGTDPHAAEAVEIFCAMLGTTAGNLALTVGARGGIFIGGGIVPQLGTLFDRSAFRERFVAKGRMQSFLDPIPTVIMTAPTPAFIGLAALVAEEG